MNKALRIGGWACICLVCLSVFMLMLKTDKMASGDGARYNFVIALDAGHGGVDGGVVGVNTKTKESDLNLAVVYMVKDCFETSGFPVVLTRKDKNGLYGEATPGFKRRDMAKRREIIQKAKANMVISIHMNKFSSPSRNGPQVFFDKDSESGKALAKSIQTVLNDFTGNKHTELKGDYFMLKCTASPSVIVECGFLSNSEDERKLVDKDYQKKLADKIFRGALLYMSSAGLINAD